MTDTDKSSKFETYVREVQEAITDAVLGGTTPKSDADFLVAFVAIRDSLADLTDHDRNLVLASLRHYAARVRDEALHHEIERFVENAPVR